MLRQQVLSTFEVAVWQELALCGAALLLLGLMAACCARYHLRRREERHQAHTRSCIAANLHDELGSLLMRLHLQAETMLRQSPGPNPNLQQMLATTQAVSSAMRDVAWGLDARADSMEALQDRMRDLLDQFQLNTPLHLSVATEGLEGTEKLPNLVRQEFYLVFKEATTNVMRHAQGASYLAARLYRQKNNLVLEVLDDGAPPTRPVRHGMGLRNMQQRAQKVGGKLEAGPRADGPGFRVSFCAPLSPSFWQ